MQKKLFEIKNEAKELGTKTDQELNERIEKVKKITIDPSGLMADVKPENNSYEIK